MRPIRLLDLPRIHAPLRPELDAAIARVIDAGVFIRGDEVDAFERDLAAFTGAKHVVSCGNGTDALQIALMALGVEAGAEVIVPDFAFAAPAEVVALLRARPVLVDVDPHTFTLCPASVARAITPRTRAIVAVHLFGQCAPMTDLLALSDRIDVPIVEDAAQALGATYRLADGQSRQAGTMGKIGATSFFPSKNLGALGDGGALFTDDDDLARRARAIASHGQVERYRHDLVGVNSRLDSLQAAVLRVKLPKLLAHAERRQAIAKRYDAAVAEAPRVIAPVADSASTHTYHQYTVKLESGARDAFARRLLERGVPSQVHYPRPLHAQRAFADCDEQACPVATELAGRVLSLPMHAALDDEQAEAVARALVEASR